MRLWYLTALLVDALVLALFFQTPTDVPATSLSLQGVLAQSLELRSKGRFDAAEEMLRGWLAGHPQDSQAARALLGILEDSGKVDAYVDESRKYGERWPDDRYGDWSLARGLLFRAALQPSSAASGLKEVATITTSLDAARWAPEESPGARSILWMQWYFLQGQWANADARALEAMKLGTTRGESADLQTMRLDLALREGRMDEARRMLDECLKTVRSWRGQPVYYQLFPYREAALWVRVTYYGEKITRAELNAPDALYQTLAADGMEERLALSLVRHGLLQYIELDEKQDYATLLGVAEAFFRQYPPAHSPTCFYGETVYLPVVASAAHLLMGDLCARLGRPEDARRHYEEGLRAHPDDWTLRQRLAKLGPP